MLRMRLSVVMPAILCVTACSSAPVTISESAITKIHPETAYSMLKTYPDKYRSWLGQGPYCRFEKDGVWLNKNGEPQKFHYTELQVKHEDVIAHIKVSILPKDKALASVGTRCYAAGFDESHTGKERTGYEYYGGEKAVTRLLTEFTQAFVTLGGHYPATQQN